MSARRKNNDAQKARVENAGVLTASGLIAGEALMGLFIATVAFIKDQMGGEANSGPLAALKQSHRGWRCNFCCPCILSHLRSSFKSGKSGRTSTSPAIM